MRYGYAVRGCLRRKLARGRLPPPPMTPTSFYKVTGAFRLGLILPSPAPYMKPRRSAPLTGAGASAFPRTPLSAGGKERATWLPPTFKLTAPAVASASVCDLAAYCSPSGRSTPENTSGVFVPPYSLGAAFLRCRFVASARGTKSLPCGLRARGRPARYERVQAETDRDRFCVSANGRVQTNAPTTTVSDRSDKSDQPAFALAANARVPK